MFKVKTNLKKGKMIILNMFNKNQNMKTHYLASEIVGV